MCEAEATETNRDQNELLESLLQLVLVLGRGGEEGWVVCVCVVGGGGGRGK